MGGGKRHITLLCGRRTVLQLVKPTNRRCTALLHASVPTIAVPRAARPTTNSLPKVAVAVVVDVCGWVHVAEALGRQHQRNVVVCHNLQQLTEEGALGLQFSVSVELRASRNRAQGLGGMENAKNASSVQPPSAPQPPAPLVPHTCISASNTTTSSDSGIASGLAACSW